MHRAMTQAELAAAIGVSRNVVFNIEHGLTRIDYREMERIAVALHCKVDDLADRTKGARARLLPSWAGIQASFRAPEVRPSSEDHYLAVRRGGPVGEPQAREAASAF
jgi:transcriptional regulator with XRE-family HTH domain